MAGIEARRVAVALALALALPSVALGKDKKDRPGDEVTKTAPEEAAPEGVAEPVKWAKQPLDYRYESEFTAYTIPEKSVRVGLFNLDYGLTDDFSFGTSPLFDVYGFYSLRAKSTVFTIGRFDTSLEAMVGYGDASRLSALSVSLVNYPITLRASWSPFDRLGIHGGFRWQNVNTAGSFAIDDLAETLAPIIGVKLPKSVKDSLGRAGSIYGGAHFTLGQPLVALDWRFNRRDSLILQYEGFSTLRGRIDAGYLAEDNTEYMAGVRAKENLFGQVKGTTTISWQFSYESFAFRVGLPLTSPKSFAQDYAVLFVAKQAFTVYWLF
jgi:hypothetical protein